MAAVLETYMRWPSWRKAVLLLGLVAAIGAAYFFVAFKPGMAQLNGLGKTYSELDSTLLEKQAIAANLPVVKEQVRKLDAELAKALTKLPTSEEIPKLLKNVSNIGVEGGLEFLLFKPQSTKPVPPKYFYAEVPLRIENSGTFHELATFFDRVGRLPRIVTIENITVGSPEYVPGGPPQLKASYTATTFKFLPPEERPKPDTGKKGKRGSRKK